MSSVCCFFVCRRIQWIFRFPTARPPLQRICVELKLIWTLWVWSRPLVTASVAHRREMKSHPSSNGLKMKVPQTWPLTSKLTKSFIFNLTYLILIQVSFSVHHQKHVQPITHTLFKYCSYILNEISRCEYFYDHSVDYCFIWKFYLLSACYSSHKPQNADRQFVCVFMIHLIINSSCLCVSNVKCVCVICLLRKVCWHSDDNTCSTRHTGCFIRPQRQPHMVQRRWSAVCRRHWRLCGHRRPADLKHWHRRERHHHIICLTVHSFLLKLHVPDYTRDTLQMCFWQSLCSDIRRLKAC